METESELRAFSKGNQAEERKKVAQDIRENRREYFERQRDVSNQIKEVEDAVREKSSRFSELEQKVESLNNTLEQENLNIFLKLTDFLCRRELKHVLEEEEMLEREIAEKQEILDDLRLYQQSRKELEKAREELEKFYQNAGVEFQEYKQEQVARSVRKVGEEYDVLFVHSIDTGHVPGPNSPLNDTNVPFEVKLKILLGLEPTISASTIGKGDTARNMWASSGVLLKGGRIQDAFPFDAGSVVVGIRERVIRGGDAVDFRSQNNVNVHEAVDIAIKRRDERQRFSNHNEFIVEQPEVAALYVELSGEGMERLVPRTVQDSEIATVSQELDLPVYGLVRGNLHEVAYDREGNCFRPKEEVIPNETVTNNSFSLSDEQRASLTEEALSEEYFKESFCEKVENHP